ncbi:protein of unknown function [Pseudodesulfovibrio profundus]|jgi:hypothetical protein|uniref:Uncharacterized protein n=1 Tax=Pseudodesulfovibrio profundus TaxID=57320 RepID=A0A2C8F5A6_9BACT|nr:hypothetical protein [Pseudodesulfovibrio profundus]SOB57603.1 protein of unknown function [Pseudodesulfovibrio profundus]
MKKMPTKTNTLAAKALGLFLASNGPRALTIDGGSCGQIGTFLGGTLIKDGLGNVALCDAVQIETGTMIFVTPLTTGAVELMAVGDGDDATWHLGVCVPALDEDKIDAEYAAMAEVAGSKIDATRDDQMRYMAVAMELLGMDISDRKVELIDKKIDEMARARGEI